MKTALLIDGPHWGAVVGLDADTHPMVVRVQDCDHETTCRYQVAGGQQGRKAAAYRHLVAQ